MAKLTYEIEMTPENASKIDAVNKILLGGAYTEEAATASKEDSSSVSFEDVKAAAKKAKSDHGDDFAMKVLIDAGIETKSTLGRSIAAIPENQYESVIAVWQTGPQESEEEELEDELDDDLDDEDEGDVDPDAVKTALKAYSKEHGRDKAKEIMSKHKVKALSGVDDLNGSTLAKLMKELV